MFLERTVTVGKNNDRPAPADTRRSNLFFPIVRGRARLHLLPFANGPTAPAPRGRSN